MDGWFFFFQAEDGIRDIGVTGVQTCALPISTMASSVLLSSRVSRVLPYHWMLPSRADSEQASCGFMGSSMTIRLPPRPVSVPPVEVVRRLHPSVVANSNSVSLVGLIHVFGNMRWYKVD